MAILSSQASSSPTAIRTAEASSDDELVAEVRAGDERAFEELYARYQRRIAAFVHGRLGDASRTEELTQDVFLSALRRIRETDRPIAFKPWIHEIAKNACIDQFRRSQHRSEVSYDDLAAADRGRPVLRTPPPEVAVARKQSVDDLLGAFAGLEPTHHRVLVLRELEGRSYEEIGARLDMTQAAVESTLFRARRRLGQEYEAAVTGQRCGRVRDLIATVSTSAPGVRDRRRLSAHLGHCEPCRRQAAFAGLQVAALAPRGIRGRIAGLLPLPDLLWRRLSGESRPGRSRGAAVAQLSAQVGTSVDPALGGWVRAAAAAVALAVAGVAGSGAVRDRERPPASGTSPSSLARSATASAATPAARATATRPIGGAAASSPDGRGAALAPAASGAVTGGRGRVTGGRGGATTPSPGTAGGGGPAGAGATPAGRSATAPALPVPSGVAGGRIPGVPAIKVPSVPRVPATPAVTVPRVPGTPGIKIPGVAGTPPVTVPSVPGTPPVKVPSIPVPTVKVPSVPAPPAVKVPGVPAPPAVQVPGVPAPPAVQVPSVPAPPAVQVPIVPAVPAVPPPPAVPGGVLPGG